MMKTPPAGARAVTSESTADSEGSGSDSDAVDDESMLSALAPDESSMIDLDIDLDDTDAPQL